VAQTYGTGTETDCPVAVSGTNLVWQAPCTSALMKQPLHSYTPFWYRAAGVVLLSGLLLLLQQCGSVQP